MKSNGSKLSVAYFGMGLFCGLLLRGGDLSYIIIATTVGASVFYVTDAALRVFGTRHKIP